MDVRMECVEAKRVLQVGDLLIGDSFLCEEQVYMKVDPLVDGSPITRAFREGYQLVVRLDNGHMQTLHETTGVFRINRFEVVLKRDCVD